MVYNFCDKKTSGTGVNNEIKQNQQLAQELHKPIFKKFQKGRVYSSIKDNIWGADLADMQLISIRFNKRIRFLLCVIDIYSKCAWVVPSKDKKGFTIVHAFQNISDDSIKLNSMKKPNKIWEDKGSELYNSSFKKWLKDNDIEMHSTHNEGKSVVAQRFVRTL